MEELGVPLLVHGEATDPASTSSTARRCSSSACCSRCCCVTRIAKVVFEHITTSDAADFVAAAAPNVAATITAHHLLYNRNAIFAGGLRPHYYCLPVLKREQHRLDLLTRPLRQPEVLPRNRFGAACAGRARKPPAAVRVAIRRTRRSNSTPKPSRRGPLGSAGSVRQLQRPRLLWPAAQSRQGDAGTEDWLVPTALPTAATCWCRLRAGERLPWRLLD
jgi:dihydroorotase